MFFRINVVDNKFVEMLNQEDGLGP